MPSSEPPEARWRRRSVLTLPGGYTEEGFFLPVGPTASVGLGDRFERTAERQYTKALLFSSLVDLMSLVVCGSAPHVQAGFQRLRDRLPVSLKCVYEKLQRLETGVSAALVRVTADKCQALVRELDGALPDPV